MQESITYGLVLQEQMGHQLLPSQMQSAAYRISKMLLHTCSFF